MIREDDSPLRLGRTLHRPKPDDQPDQLQDNSISPANVAEAHRGRTFEEWSAICDVSMNTYLAIAEKNPDLTIADIEWSLNHPGATPQEIDQYVASRHDSLARDLDY